MAMELRFGRHWRWATDTAGLAGSIRTVTAFAASLCLALPAAAALSGPEEAVSAFYRWALAHPATGLPSAKQRVPLAGVLSPKLVQLLKDASDMQSRCMVAVAGDEKPLLIEGDVFVGNHEGASEVAYGALFREGEVATFEARLMYVDRRFPKAHTHRAVAWKDSVELRRHEGRWRVSDIRFEQGGSLVTALNDYLLEGARRCVKP